MIDFKLDLRDITDVARWYKEAGPKMLTGMARAMNHVGNKARTRVKRELAKQMGVGQKALNLRTKPAQPQRLEYEIIASGHALPLSEFRPTQLKAGVRARPWGQSKLFPGTFIISAYGGNVFRRMPAGEGRVGRLPIKKLFGPSVPKELVSEAVTKQFEATIRAEANDRLRHEMDRLLSRKPLSEMGL